MFRISTNRVHDKVRVTEGTRTLDLFVDIDPYTFVPELKAAQDRLAAVEAATDDTIPQVLQAATGFAAAIFGRQQAGKLLAFYGNHAAPAISICTRYLTRRLVNKIKRAQRAAR